ncbi:MAG TPA: hypothetical protein PKX57_10505 [Mesotoga sp.]|nr:hypothetical protein [Mesotoga sp.]
MGVTDNKKFKKEEGGSFKHEKQRKYVPAIVLDSEENKRRFSKKLLKTVEVDY